MRSNLYLMACGLAVLILCWPAQATVIAVFASESGNAIHTTAITDTEYEMDGTHTAYATAKIVSPSGRTAQSTDVQQNEAIAEVTLPLNGEAGTFMAYNWQPQEYCPRFERLFQRDTGQQPVNVSPYVQLVRTELSESTIPVRNGETTFRVFLLTTEGCNGLVRVRTATTKWPNELSMKIQGLPGGAPHDSFAYVQATMDPQSTATFEYLIYTTSINDKAGTITASAGFSAVPAGCETRGPDAGSGNSKTKTIKVK